MMRKASSAARPARSDLSDLRQSFAPSALHSALLSQSLQSLSGLRPMLLAH
jgi:hypothetical protein